MHADPGRDARRDRRHEPHAPRAVSEDFELLQDRDDDITAGFDDMRRSRAIVRLANIHALGLFTDEEFERFSPGTRETVLFLRGVER